MQMTVGTTPAQVGNDQTQGRVLLRNLGPGLLYADRSGAVAVGTGLRVDVNDSLEVFVDPSTGGSLFLVADTAGTDVRWMVA